MTVALLTGFPSFRARRLCDALLEDDGVSVRAVVRQKFRAEAELAVAALPGQKRARVTLLEGDSAALDLGLSGREIATLAGEVEVIHHAALVTYLNVEPALAEQVNVGGAREVLEIAEACKRLRCLVMHSQASVSGSFEGTFHEAELDVGQSFRNAVESTLARAERMAREAMTGLPVCVVRPSVIVGDSKTGEIDRFDGPYYLMMLMLTSPPDFALPLPGRGDVPLNLVPIDFVSRAAAAIGADPRAPGKTFHLVDPAPLAARDVFERFAIAAGRRSPRGFFSATLTSALLRTPGLERFATSPRSLVETLGTKIVYDARNANELLAAAGVTCPPLGSYVQSLASFVQAKLRARQRAKDAEVEDPLS